MTIDDSLTFGNFGFFGYKILLFISQFLRIFRMKRENEKKTKPFQSLLLFAYAFFRNKIPTILKHITAKILMV